MEPWIIVTLTWLLLIAGLVGTLFPGIPGVVLVFGGILFYALFFGIQTVGLTTLVLFGVATICSLSFDALASMYGVARFGGSRVGVIGSALGGILGFIFLNLPGLFLGLFVGAVASERFLGGRDWRAALRIGVGSLVGFLVGSIVSFVLALVMVAVFAWKIWF